MGTFFIITIVMVAICIQVYFLQDSVKKTNLQKTYFQIKGDIVLPGITFLPTNLVIQATKS